MPAEPRSNTADSVAAELSVARLLDDARQRLIEAWDRDEEPQYLLVHPRLYDVVAEAKAREIRAGKALRLLGLLLVSSDTTGLESPEVR
jgi:hypothetical protein